MTEIIKLTEIAKSGGCAAKLGPKILSSFISKLTYYKNEKLLVGIENFGDCGIYKLNETQAIVHSIDFFPPMVDNPIDYGAIAVSNALSDIYACGATPITALNLICFPEDKLSLAILEEIMKGATQKLEESKTVLLGGHTIKDSSLIFGFAVTGIININEIVTSSNAQIGDHLILTKPIGSGLVNTAVKMKLNLKNELVNETLEIMKKLNDKASELMKEFKASACTDVTGFSLIGHSHEMAYSSDVSIKLFSKFIPIINGINDELIKLSKCSGTTRNFNFYNRLTKKSNSCVLNDSLLYDPQTSGGLLISVPRKNSNELKKQLVKSGYIYSDIIGEVIQKTDKEIIVE